MLFNFSFYLTILLVVISVSMLFATLRRRFFFFILTVVVFSIWGFMLDLDGMMLVLLTAEFTIVLLFLMTYIQLYSNYQFVSSKKMYYFIYLFFAVLPTLYAPLYSFNFHSNFYNAINHIVASDFFILYYFLFDKLPVLVILMTLVISFFSLFFIIVYYNLKFTKNAKAKETKNLYFLRKQILVKQTNFNNRLYTFQN